MRRRSSLARAAYIVLRIPYVLLTSTTAAIGVKRGPRTRAVAARRYDGSIAKVHREVDARSSPHRWARIPPFKVWWPCARP